MVSIVGFKNFKIKIAHDTVYIYIYGYKYCATLWASLLEANRLFEGLFFIPTHGFSSETAFEEL